MGHLLEEGIEECGGFRNGIYWCMRRGEPQHENVRRLQERIGANLRVVEIDGFDEVMAALDRELEGEAWYSGADDPLPIASVGHADELPFDRHPMDGVTLDDLDRDLVLATLTDYCKRLN